MSITKLWEVEKVPFSKKHGRLKKHLFSCERQSDY